MDKTGFTAAPRNSGIFKASPDLTARVITDIILIFFCLALIAAITCGLQKPTTFLPPLVLMLIIFFTWLFRPEYYEVTATELIIHPQIMQVTIPKTSISAVQQLQRSVLSRSIRTFGVGGLFGYYGKFSIPETGPVSAYTTNGKNPVLIVTANRKILLSPDEPEAFIKALQ